MSAIVGFVSQAQIASGQLQQMLQGTPESLWLLVWGTSLWYLAARTRRAIAMSRTRPVQVPSTPARVAPSAEPGFEATY
jgi:hypothetical protein